MGTIAERAILTATASTEGMSTRFERNGIGAWRCHNQPDWSCWTGDRHELQYNDGASERIAKIIGLMLIFRSALLVL